MLKLHLLLMVHVHHKLVYCYSIEKRTETKMKTFKKESDVVMLLKHEAMLLSGLQALKRAPCRDAGQWLYTGNETSSTKVCSH